MYSCLLSPVMAYLSQVRRWCMMTLIRGGRATARWSSAAAVRCIMPRRAPKTSLQERRAILARAQAGQTAPHIAADLGWSVHTVRKWRRIGRHNDAAALSPRIGRAPTGALSTFPPALPAAIRRLRQDHPGWGPRTLLLDLQRDPYWSTQPLPSRSQVAAFLKQQGLTRSYHKHRDLPHTRACLSSFTIPAIRVLRCKRTTGGEHMVWLRN